MRNKTTAALLAIFLGDLGIHKFYLGRNGEGVLYLLFCWTFIPAIIGFLEGIVLLSMDEKVFNERYNLNTSNQSKGEMKKCPFCAEIIKKEAVKCKHCGSEIPHIEDTQTKSESKTEEKSEKSTVLK